MGQITTWDEFPTVEYIPGVFRQAVSGEKTMLTRIVYRGGVVIPDHSHEAEQIMLVVQGRLWARVGDEESEVGPGSLLIIPSNYVHAFRQLTDEDVARIASTYHTWRGEKAAGDYADIAGFCKSAAIDEVRKHGHVLTPGRYVGAEAVEDDGEPFPEKFARLRQQLEEQFAEGAKLEAQIRENLARLGLAMEGKTQ